MIGKECVLYIRFKYYRQANPNQSLVTTKERFGLFSSGGIDALAKELADD